jgi:hypothetical protein
MRLAGWKSRDMLAAAAPAPPTPAPARPTAGYRRLHGSSAAEGGTLQPTSPAVCLDRACTLPGCHAGLVGWFPTLGWLASPESTLAILNPLGDPPVAISEPVPAPRINPLITTATPTVMGPQATV